MSDMEYNNHSLDKATCFDYVVTVKQMDETFVQLNKHSRCLIISGVFILIGVIIFAVVVVPKFGHGQQNDRDDSPRTLPPAQHEYMVWKIKRSLEAPANSPITNVDHEASGCPESYCKRCSANVPDSLEGDENNYAMTCPNIDCHDSLLYDELLEKFGKTTSCGRVNCCMLKWSRPKDYCKNGGSLKCFNGKEPICVCLKGWTGDTCETPRETQVNCSCYNKELIHDQTLSGQRFMPKCLSSNKTSTWEKCHMNKDKFNCICERTENNEEARNLTLPSCDVTADPPTSANVDHEASGCSESYCKRCSANVPDPLEGDENNNAMTCPNIYCHDSLLYDELLEKFGKTTSCGRVNCCMLKWSRPKDYCKNGGSLKCFNGKEPICACLKGWTGDTCETPRETQVNCSCYNKELIHDQTLSGQRSLPECLSSNKTSTWEKCHMNKDKFNCICERTENNEEARNLTLPSCDVTADPPTSANVDHEASGCSESYCKRCSANVPDPLEGDENNNAMTCPNIYCHDSLLYDELLEKFGKTTSCGRVNCCMLKWSRPEGYCKNGGSLKCFNGKEPICVCLKGTSWTGDTCETPRETQVNCSCYNKELIHDQTLSGQRSLPECLSSSKSSPWEKCHMNKDKFNCICERTENNEEARNLTLPSCDDVTADPRTSAAEHILSGHLTTVLVFVLTVCIRNTDLERSQEIY
ncbi:neurogenic locus notch homolog protein 1-like [Mya arenaria]|uniref:neurogenic locus notch homolog protein 1-like n=1 Tax=Mya arenaria TaxID=6604 RepID=UPI0022DF07EB|nr:neurogenic locus notch homolog protein 1-like [Mya arenaria]